MPLQEQMKDYQQIVLKIDVQDSIDSNQNKYISWIIKTPVFSGVFIYWVNYDGRCLCMEV